MWRYHEHLRAPQPAALRPALWSHASWSIVTLRLMDASLWVAIISLVVGGGGLAVAILGYRSNRKAIEDAWVREWAAHRPVVYPVLLDEWLSGSGTAYQHGRHKRLIPLKNGGRGPALNVRGSLTVTTESGQHVHEILASTIAAGDLLNARLVPPCDAPTGWSGAQGMVTFRDLSGGTWQQPFDFKKSSHGELELDVQEPTQTPLAISAPAQE